MSASTFSSSVAEGLGLQEMLTIKNFLSDGAWEHISYPYATVATSEVRFLALPVDASSSDQAIREAFHKAFPEPANTYLDGPSIERTTTSASALFARTSVEFTDDYGDVIEVFPGISRLVKIRRVTVLEALNWVSGIKRIGESQRFTRDSVSSALMRGVTVIPAGYVPLAKDLDTRKVKELHGNVSHFIRKLADRCERSAECLIGSNAGWEMFHSPAEELVTALNGLATRVRFESDRP